MDRMIKLLKSRTVKNFIYFFSNVVLKILYVPFCLLPIRDKQIAVINYGGKGYGDNPKYVTEALLRQSDGVNIVWLVSKRGNCFPEGINEVKLYSFEGFRCFATSKVWLSNARLPFFLIKRKKQVYFQLWHGGCGPKKIEAAANNLIQWYICAAKHDSKMADYFVSNSDFNTRVFAHDFWYDGEILKYGSPRHDILLGTDESKIKKVRASLRINEDRKILLYAPTFRDSKDYSIYKWDYEAVLKAVKEKFGGEWCFVLRLHPNISFFSSEFCYGESVKNGSLYDDMQELIAAADVMITDYSGTMMQAALAKKMVFLYVSDEREYLDERGFCFDLEKSPFPMAGSIDGVIDNINRFQMAEYMDDLKLFLSTFAFYDDGNASSRVANKILEYIDSE